MPARSVEAGIANQTARPSGVTPGSALSALSSRVTPEHTGQYQKPASGVTARDNRHSRHALSQAASSYDLSDFLGSRDTQGTPLPPVQQTDQGRSALNAILDDYLNGSSPATPQPTKSAEYRHARDALAKEALAKIHRMLNRQGAVPTRWEPDCGPLAGTPNADLTTLQPTGHIFGMGSFGCVVGFQAKRSGKPADDVSGNASENQVQLAAKFLFDEQGVLGAASSKAKAVDRLRDELEIYRAIIDAKHEGKALGTHPNLCEIYGIATMEVDGVEMRALLMEAVPGHDAQKTADILRRCLEARYLTAREYWGAIQYLCDSTLRAAEHLRIADIVHRDIKQENVLVRKDGAVKVIDYGLATIKGDRNRRGTPDYMADDHRKASGVTAATDAFAIGATTAEFVEGYDRKFSKKTGGELVVLLPKDGAKRGYIQRTDARGKVVETPVNQINSAYSRFVNSLLKRTSENNPVERKAADITPNDAKKMDFIADPLMDHEEAQAVIRAAFTLMEIEGKKEDSARWEPRVNARQIALRLIRKERARATGEDLASSPVAVFRERPDLKNYVDLQQHYSMAPDQKKKITEVLGSIPDNALKALNEEISNTFQSEGRRLFKEGFWLAGFSSRYQTSEETGTRRAPSTRLRQATPYSNETSIVEGLLKQQNKSIEDLRAYIVDANKLFKELKLVSHDLTPVNWRRFDAVGGMTRTAIRMMWEHIGIQQAAFNQRHRDSYQSS